MKAKEQHRVPLSDAAVAVLKRVHNIRQGGLVFLVDFPAVRWDR
jgi:hypothetical protein